MISLLVTALAYCCSRRDLHFSISDLFDKMSYPIRACAFFRSLTPNFHHAYAHTNTHMASLWSGGGGGISDSSLISHVLVLNFSKGDRQLLQLASEAITTLPRERLAHCYSASQQSFKEMRNAF